MTARSELTLNNPADQDLYSVGPLGSENDPYYKYSATELILSELRIKRHERIPVSSLILEDSLVDEAHVESLARSMEGDRGQISPITVRARFTEEGAIGYDIIDGFHRSHGLSLLEQKRRKPHAAHAIVVYACPDEELYDLRVLAANSVGSVKFARMADWMRSSFISAQWENEGLYEKVANGRINIAQIFSLAQQNSSGMILGLTQSESTEVKAWAKSKARSWNRPLGTLAQELHTIEVADPELVKKVRKGGGGKDGRGTLTHARLKSIVEKLPYKYEIQNRLVQLAIDYNFVATEMSQLAEQIAEAEEKRDFHLVRDLLQNPENYLTQTLSVSDTGEDLEVEAEQAPKKTKIRGSIPPDTNITVPVSSVNFGVTSEDESLDMETENPYGQADTTVRTEIGIENQRLMEVNRLQGVIIDVLTKRRQLKNPSEHMTDAILGTLQRKLELLDGEIYSRPKTLDSIAGITFDDTKGQIKYKGMNREAQLSRVEADILWMLKFHEGRYIDYKTINFMLNNDVVVGQVITGLQEKLDTISHGLGKSISYDSTRGYIWTGRK